jgi:hypothetical protein
MPDSEDASPPQSLVGGPAIVAALMATLPDLSIVNSRFVSIL